jgi:phosphoglycolate phosphatase-like HAD superfamily hydrolase
VSSRFTATRSATLTSQLPRQLLYASYDDGLVSFGDAVTTARQLRAEGMPLALVTSSQRERLERTLLAADLDGFFTATVAGDEVTRGKPAPDGYLLRPPRCSVSTRPTASLSKTAKPASTPRKTQGYPSWPCRVLGFCAH